MSEDRIPNLLVVGVAKSGTSSLHNYLSQHPDIFMSAKKEPRYITSQVCKLPLGGPKDDKVESWYVKSKTEYSDLFKGTEKYKFVGESSADTFYFHEKTIPFIKKNFGDPVIIIVIRNPIKRAFSAYQHLRRDDREQLEFKEALQMEDDRIRKNYELIYHYKSVGLYAKGIQAFLNNFSQVKVILNEDLSIDPQVVLKDLFAFLNLNTTIPLDTSQRYNKSGIPKSRWLHEVLFEGKKINRVIRPFARLLLSKSKRDRISRYLFNANLDPLRMKQEDELYLKNYFKQDILETSKILNRSLDIWK